MILELGFALLLGLLIGTITGLAPGIHINLISAILLGLSTFLLSLVSPIVLVVFLVSMAMTHTFVDYIPSIFLGAPDEENFLSILPGHEMLIKGEAYSAVVYTLYGSLSGLLIILLFSPLFFFFLPIIYPYAERIMPFILILTCFFLIYFEKSSKLWAFLIFIISGLLGISVLNLPIKEPLLPLFTGLFGVSSLITSITKKQTIPLQKIKPLKEITIPKKSFFKSILASLIASPLCSFLPGMGSGQAAVIGSEVTGDLDRKEFLVLLGAINTIVTGLSFITLYTISKARTGVAVAIEEIIQLSVKDLFIITGVIFLSGIISFFITIFITKYFAKFVSKVNYQILSIIIILILFLVVFYFSGFLGFLAMLISSCIGLTCIYSGVRRTHMMGSLLISTILYYIL